MEKQIQKQAILVKERLQYHFGNINGGYNIPQQFPFMKEFIAEVDKLCALANAGTSEKDLRVCEVSVSVLHSIREAVANYMYSEGCSCCQDVDAHREHTKKLGELLDVEPYSDNSGFDFSKYRSTGR